MFKDFFKSSRNDLLYLRENSEKPLEKSIFNDTVRKAFVEFCKLNQSKDLAIIGGLAVGAWARSRNTDDIDVVVVSENDVEELAKNISGTFKRTRKHAFEHKSSGVEIEIVTPELIKEDPELIRKAIANAKVDEVSGNSIKVITPKYLIALKLGRAVLKGNAKAKIDQGDIMNLIEIYGKISLDDLNLSEDKMKLYNELAKEILEKE
jgi:deoxyadenosine/deoxycytidine kinase